MRLLLLLLLPLTPAGWSAPPDTRVEKHTASARTPAADTCPVTGMDLNSSIQDTLAATDCRVQDVIATSSAQTYVRQYRLTVTQKGVLTATMKSTAFDVLLYLYNSTYTRRLASNANADGPGTARITISLNPGTYFLFATSRVVATGAFTLDNTFQPPHDCPVQDLALDQVINGAFTSSSCRGLDLSSTSTDLTYVDQYRVAVTSRKVLTINLSSNDFTPIMGLFDSNDELIVSSDDYDDPLAPMLVSLPQDTYTLLVTQTKPATGGYALRGSLADPRDCPVKDIAANDKLTGNLSPDGCRYLDVFDFSNDETPADLYRMTVGKRTVATIDMTSTAFNTYLEVTDPQYDRTFADVDVNKEESSSHILVSLDPATYIIVANSFDVGGGPYTLSLILEDPRPCPLQDIDPSGGANGRLSSGSCRFLDLVPSTDATYVDPYRLTLKDRAVTAIDMASPDFDAYLMVTEPQYKNLYAYNNDAAKNTTDSHIYVSLNAGTYVILATSLDIATGGYTLKTASEPPRSCPIQDIGVSDTVAGSLSTMSCRMLDWLSPETDTTAADQYRVTIVKSGTLTIDLTSADFDNFLYLFDSTYKHYVDDDDSGGGTNARLVVKLDPGTYYIFANTIDTKTGSYTLKLQFQESAAPVSQ